MRILRELVGAFFDRRVPLFSKLLFIVFVGGYALFPLDLLPDILLPLGIVDDGAVLLGATTVFTRYARQKKLKENKHEKETR